MSILKVANPGGAKITRLAVTKHYGGVIIVCGALALQQYYNAFGIIMPLRKLLFTEKYMSQWDEMHQYYLKTKPSPFGYPDAGAGVYSKKLEYGDWFKFNNAQRVHGNSIEHLSHAIPTMLLAGLFYPKVVAALGVSMLVGREMYLNGYLKEGPNSKIRFAGGVAVVIPEIMILIFLMGAGVWRGMFRNPIIGMRRVKKRRMSVIDHHIEQLKKN